MIDGHRLMLTAWVGDMWILARNAHELETMVADLLEAASTRAGLELSIPKCTWSPVQMRGQDTLERRETEDTHLDLSAMERLPPGQCLRMLGTCA